MAHRYEGRIPLGSTMREKNEFSPSAAQKHTSSLRIPEDTSWPKIPERRIHDNVVSGGKAPCFVTLSGKPQKNRTTVQLPHSTFVKAAPRRNELECHNSAHRFAPLQSNTREGCANSAFATQITPSSQMKAKKPIENDIKEKPDHIKNAANTDPEKECEANVLGDAKASRVQLNGTSAEATKYSAAINQDACIPTANKFKVTSSSHSQELNEVKKYNDAQDVRDFRNVNEQYVILTTDDDNIKKCSAPSSICSSASRDHQDCLCNSTSERQWAPAISRSSRLHAVETTDSELYSSDTTKSGVTQTSTDLRTRHVDKKGLKDYPRKGCYLGSKTPTNKGDPGSCCSSSVRCDKCRPRKPRHRSEPQIGNSPGGRRCWTAHGRPVCCCAKDFHRVASDSNCWSAMHASTDPGACSGKELPQRRQQSAQSEEAEDALSCLAEDDAKREEIDLKVQRLLDTERQRAAEEHSAYASQLAMGAPQVKRRRSAKDGQLAYQVDALTMFTGARKQIEARPVAGVSVEERLAATKGGTIQSLARTATCPHKTNPPGDKQDYSRFFKLKTAVILSCAILVLILSLPMIYDYFFYEEYDSYEELSYFELVLEYIISSFQEAFGGLFDLISKMFFHSRTCRKCNNVN